MRKTAVLLLCLCLLFFTSVTALAATVTQNDSGGSTEISVTVPDSHTLTVEAEHAQVFLEGKAGEAFTVERLAQPRLLIRPENGYRVTKVTLNGEDITEQVKNGYYTLEPVCEEKTLTVETVEAPANPDSSHDISGIIKDEDGNPIPGAVVDIGGKTATTDEDGNFTIDDVPDGFHTVTVTDEDGNIIGYTEIEIGEGDDTGAVENPDGSHTLTTPEDAALDMEFTVRDDGTITVDSLTENKTSICLWIILLLVLAAILTVVVIYIKKRKANR